LAASVLMHCTVCYKSAVPVPVVSARALARNLLRW